MSYNPKLGFIDGDWTHATAVSLPVFSSPIPATTAQYVLTQDFMQSLNSFAPLPLDTRHDVYSDYFLVSEGPRNDLGGGMVRWTRVYLKVPDSYDEFESFAYRFIGKAGFAIALSSDPGVSPSGPFGREPYTRVVPSRVQHDFFLVDQNIPNPIDNKVYRTPGDIPTILAMRYVFISTDTPADYLTNNPPYAVTSIPSRTIYESWGTNAAVEGWASPVAVVSFPNLSTVPKVTDTGGQIPVEDSRLVRYMGNVWLRTTRFVLAQ